MLHQTIFVVDVASFTDPARTMLHHRAVREGMYDVLHSAFAEAGIDLAACTVEDRGDGALILVPPEVAKSRLADQLPSRLVAGLRRHNAVHSAEAAVQLRVALHAGEVYQDEHGMGGQAVNIAFRILEAPEAKSALRLSTGVLALIASDAFYHEVIVHDPAADPRSYQQIPVPAMEASAMAWLRLPDRVAVANGEMQQSAPRVQTRVSAGMAIAVREAVVETLVEAGLADDVPGCSLLIQTISNYVTTPPRLPQYSVSRDHLVELVNACATVEGGMIALARAVWMIRPGSPEYARICQLIDEPRVLDLLPATELSRVREWLIMITIPQLRTLVYRAAGPGTPPTEGVANAWEAFSYLAEFNAGADGFPPALTFIELVARHVGGVLSANLTGWNDDQARRLRLEPALWKRRAAGVSPVPVESRLHLMIVVELDGIDPDRYLVSHWRQDDVAVWPPTRGETRMVMSDELERCVDDLVVNAERAWSGHAGSVALEFVLPRALLNLPLHLWRKEHDSGYPRPLCLDYPIVVRSLERMRSSQWHRVWQRRWKVLMIDPSAARVHFGQPADTREPHRIDAILSDPQVVLMVLTSAPLPQPRPGADELAAALRSGLPALVWHPEASSEVLRGVVTWLLEGDGLGDLPGRAQALRQAAFQASGAPFDMNIARELVVLWDDPDRSVILDQPPDQLQSRGDIADERGRAS
ncbi:MAG: effector-associated domain 2-containing protein [Pseudonocardiaceae bacterium]